MPSYYYRVDATYTYYQNGRVFYDGSTYRDYKVVLPYTRSSVNSGYFVPGEYRVNPYSASRGTVKMEENEDLLCFYSTTSGGKLYEYVFTATGAVLSNALDLARINVPMPSTAVYQQLALQKAKGKLLSADLGLGETVGEYRETIKMLKKPLGDLFTFLWSDRARNWRLLLALLRKDRRDVSRLTGRTALASADTMASTWLELRYGLRPLVLLVQDVVDKVNEKREAVWDPDKIRSSRSTLIFNENHGYDASYSLGSMYVKAHVEVKDVIKVSSSWQFRQERDQSLVDQLGLTPRFLPETLWELTRLSFVVDWIFSIGDWLATLRWNPSVNILGNTVSVKVVRTYTIHGFDYGRNETGYAHRGSEAVVKEEHIDRFVDVDLSYKPHFTWLRVMDLFKIVDSLSLFWQLCMSKLLKKRRR